jgi:D-lyxose ketol-isomerase
MKRSEINRLISDAIEFLDAMKFKLPPWAYWSPADWKGRAADCQELRRSHLGWDITDFGSGDFLKTGLLLFTLRNGSIDGKPYAEKAMIVQAGQETPMHFHWRKTEDIINRGGSTLVMTLNKAAADDDGRFNKAPFSVFIDGISHLCHPGETIRLEPGESVCLTPGVYHSFRAEGGPCFVGEVSSVNDDSIDNRFHKPCGRFPSIEEDEAPRYLLCMELPS